MASDFAGRRRRDRLASHMINPYELRTKWEASTASPIEWKLDLG